MSFKPLTISPLICFASLVIATAVFVGTGASGDRGKWRVVSDEWQETRQMHEGATALQEPQGANASQPSEGAAAPQASGSATAQAPRVSPLGAPNELPNPYRPGVSWGARWERQAATPVAPA